MLKQMLLVTLLIAQAACGLIAESEPAQAAAADAGDYMSPELRRAVETLKRDVAAEPTSEATALARSGVLFDWINAYALNGGYVPVNATAAVAQVTAYGLAGGEQIDQFVRELTVHDERPEAIGTLSLTPKQSYPARSFATFTQSYVVGEAAVEPGGGFLVAKHFQTSGGRYQADDPAGASYVTIRSNRDDVSFEPHRVPVAGMHGGFRGQEGQLAFRVRGAALQPGDRVDITYGDTSGGGPGLRMPEIVSEQMPYPLYVDLDGSGLWLSLPLQPVSVHGSRLAGVRGFAPSIIATGEEVALSIRAEDRYGNRASGELPDWQVRDGDRVLASVRAADNPVITPLRFEKPGLYRLTIHAADGSIRGPVNPILVEDDPAQRLYWGETHGHSGFSEGIGSAEAFMRFARDDARLDFVTHSEHDIWMDDAEWETLREMVRKYTDEGRFIAYLGYEWTVRTSQGGHHNVLYRTPDGRERMPAQRYPTQSRLYQALRNAHDTDDVLIIPHAHQKGDYRQSDPEMERLVEIMSGHGTFEWFGRMYLNHGHRVGFIAASDDHIGRPGYSQPRSLSIGQRGGLAGVYAPARTVDGLFDAMRNLQTYATTGERLIVDARVNDTAMGSRAPHALRRHITGRVHGTAPIRTVTLFKNDAVLKQWHLDQPRDDQLALSFYSESYPYHPQDNPRGWRHWRGSVAVSNATVTGVAGADFHNWISQTVAQDPDDPNLIHFSTMTRGDHSTLLLDVTGVGPETEIVVTLEAAEETGSGPPILRRHRPIPAADATLRVADMTDGAAVAALPFDGYQDAITLTYGSSAPWDTTFDYTDADDPRQGDYYFVRIRQMDESLAWTSPVWVGGSAPQ